MRGVILALAVLVGGLSGCAISGDAQVQSGSCENVPTGACEAQIQAAANAAGDPITDVIIKCTGVCTRAGGSGTATVIRPDGTQSTRAWTYVGDPGPLPVPVCIRIAADLCRQQVADLIGDVSVLKRLVGITVTCIDQCAPMSGNIRVDYVFADGSKETTTSGWSSGSTGRSGQERG